tara:strand:- start:130 stop:1191 length:1062 start_codon:yes stop_codon:yes gene_type:complete
MNKIYGVLALFAMIGLLLPTTVITTEAASDLDYMLVIAENAKTYIKSKIDKMEHSDSRILDLYGQSSSQINELSVAIKDRDVKSARELFISSMSNLKQISIIINQIDADKTEDSELPTHIQTIKRYEMNYNKLQQISQKLGANIDFNEMESLLSLAKQNAKQGEVTKVKQVIDQIALKGIQIYKTLQLVNEENKIVRAQALAAKYVDRINTLIVQAKNAGLLDHADRLENTKTYLIAANSTSQITQNIRIVITINNDIQEINRNNLQQVDIDEIKLSQKQKITSALNQLDTKAKLLHSEAQGSNKALYYVEKALSNIDSLRNNLDASETKINSMLQIIDQLLLKAEKIVQEST